MEEKLKAEIVEWIKYIVFAVAVAILIRSFIFMTVKVPTGSMYPTIKEGDVLLVNRLVYRFGPLERGDIVVFRLPDNPKELYIKRLIGLGGETVDISDNTVFIDGNPLEEGYVKVVMEGSFGPYSVPAEHYFMMGDNRNNSRDSRYWNNKFVPRSQVIGKAFFVLWPINRFGVLK
ncbi:MAG: Signal peptidase I [Firmicutes bacterium]|nr:Signal peptidase I [Bacillota bacterium]MDI6706019.1 signal peptidase I [Bacillota bacterium]